MTDVSLIRRSFLLTFVSSTIIRVWYLLFDGLTSAVVNCPRQYQSQAVDTLFEIFNTMQKQAS